MKWEYKVVKAETLEAFQTVLNEHRAEQWEAVFGGFTIGETKKVTLGHGMAPLWQQASPFGRLR